MPENGPRVIAWETTRRCTLQCRHCRGSARDHDYAGELTTAECGRVIDSIAALCGGGTPNAHGKPMQPIIILTGGEPMMRDDIYELAAHATAAGIRVVMAPCGHLITPETAVRLSDAGVQAISISIDGATPEAHDAFRGVEGAYQRTMEGLGFARDVGIPFQINTTVTRENVDDLPQIHDLAVALGASKLDLFFLVPTGRGAALRDLALAPRDAEAALQWALRTSRESPLSLKITCAPHSVRIWDEADAGGHPSSSAATGCMAGKGFVFISHTGILQPCGFLDVPSGDLRSADFDFGVAYRESLVFAQLRDKSGYTGKCGACEFLNSCGGCRARAFARTGDYLSAEPGCGYIPQALRTAGDSV